jgi:hypothetical protein
VLLAHRHAPVDVKAAETIGALENAHEASKPGSSFTQFLPTMKVVKSSVKEYVSTHDKKARLTKQLYGLMIVQEDIQALWARQIKHKGDGFTSADPDQKKMIDLILAKMPEARDLITTKKGSDGQPSVYVLPYSATRAAFWKRSALALEEVRAEADLPTHPTLASEGNILYKPSRTIAHPKDLRNPFSPTHSASLVKPRGTAVADSLHAKAKPIVGAASQPMVAAKGKHLSGDAKDALSSLAKLDLTYQQGIKPFAAQLKVSHLKVAAYIKAHGANDPLAKKMMFVMGMETGVEMSWQQKLRTGSQDLQVTGGRDKAELDSIVRTAPELKSKVVTRSRPGTSPIYSLSFDAIIQALRARADALLISANNAA